MSYFLIYFERSNSKADWKEFQVKGEPVIETFSKVNDPKRLFIESVKIILDNRALNANLIHDGVSSDRILEPGFKNDQAFSDKKKVLIDFLDNRLKGNRAVDHYFIVHLYNKTFNEEEVIAGYDEKEIRLSDLKEFSNAISRNVLYKLVE
jgi:hypothetical protein